MRRLLLLFVLFVPVIALAQDTPLEIGETITVPVNADSSTVIGFVLEDSSYLAIQAIATSEDFDPVIWIIDSQNRVRAYNDNANDSPDALIDNLYLYSGDYQIFVDSFTGVSEGNVEVTIETVDPNDSIVESSDGDIIITGLLLEDKVYRHHLTNLPDMPINVTIHDMSGNLDPMLTILNQDEQVIAQNDDHASLDTTLNTFDAHVADIQVIDDETIIIEVKDFLGREGEFQIIVSGNE